MKFQTRLPLGAAGQACGYAGHTLIPLQRGTLLTLVLRRLSVARFLPGSLTGPGRAELREALAPTGQKEEPITAGSRA